MGTYRPWLCVSLSVSALHGWQKCFSMPKFKFIRLPRHKLASHPTTKFDKVHSVGVDILRQSSIKAHSVGVDETSWVPL